MIDIQGTKMTIDLLDKIPESDSERPMIVEQLVIFSGMIQLHKSMGITQKRKVLGVKDKAEKLILKHNKVYGI